MPNPTALVQAFFSGYEQANADSDIQRIAACYATVFLFGGPIGIQAVKKDDFLRVLPRRKEFFKSIGLASTQIARLEEVSLDSKYVLVKVVWRMRFDGKIAEPIHSENSATYILAATDDNRFEIVFQIDHQDLLKKAQGLGMV
jgi:hypothetical protein